MPHIQATIDKEGSILLNGINNKDKALFIKLLNQIEANMKSALNDYIANEIVDCK